MPVHACPGQAVGFQGRPVATVPRWPAHRSDLGSPKGRLASEAEAVFMRCDPLDGESAAESGPLWGRQSGICAVASTQRAQVRRLLLGASVDASQAVG